MKHERIKLHPAVLFYSLCLFGIFGAIGVLIDLDHIPVLLQKGLPITSENLISQSARSLHIPLFILVGMLCVISYASVYRLRDRAL